MELPTFNPLLATKPSRYMYDCSDRRVHIPRWPCQARHPDPHGIGQDGVGDGAAHAEAGDGLFGLRFLGDEVRVELNVC